MFNAFRQSLAKIVEIQPNLIVIAGDLFHTVRPSNLTIEHTFRELHNLRAKTDAPIVLIGGNHDSPRSVDTGCILDLFKNIPGVFVVHHEYSAIEFSELDTTVFCLCHRALPGISNLKIEPNPNSRYNILTVHGTLEGIARNSYDSVIPITRAQIMHDAWDYIAFGHYHLHEKLADNAYYSGSLEYTSFNIWEEIGRPKGFIEFDLDSHEIVNFHKTTPRPVVDLRSVQADGLSATELNELIRLRLEGIEGSHDEKIVRLVIEDIPKAVIPDIDYRLIRQLRAEALHFDLQLRPLKRKGTTGDAGASGSVRPLEDEWREFARGCDVPGGVNRDELTAKGLSYLASQE